MNRELIFLLFPTLAAVCVALGSMLSRGFGRVPAIIGLLAGCLYGGYLLPELMFKPKTLLFTAGIPVGIRLYFSPFTLGFCLLLYVLIVLLLLSDPQKNSSRYVLYSLAAAGGAGLILAGDLFTQFIFLETAGVAALLISAPEDYRAGSVPILIGFQVTVIAFLGGAALVYSSAGTLNWAELSHTEPFQRRFAGVCAIVFMLPLFRLSRLFPFSRRSEQADQPVGLILLHCFCPTAALAVLARFTTLIGTEGAWAGVSFGSLGLVVLAAVTVGIACVWGVRVKTLGDLLSVATLIQVGSIVIGLAAGASQTLEGAIIVLLGHLLAKTLLILVAGLCADLSQPLKQLYGLGLDRGRRLLTSFLVLGAFSHLGLWGRVQMVSGLLQENRLPTPGSMVALVVVLVGAAVEGLLLFRLVYRLYIAGRSGRMRRHSAGRHSAGRHSAATVVLAVLVLLVGIIPVLYRPWLTAVVQELLWIPHNLVIGR